MCTSSPSTICGLELEGILVLICLNAFQKPFFCEFLWSAFERKILWQLTCGLIKQCVKKHISSFLGGIYHLKIFSWWTLAPVFWEKSIFYSLNYVIYDSSFTVSSMKWRNLEKNSVQGQDMSTCRSKQEN